MKLTLNLSLPARGLHPNHRSRNHHATGALTKKRRYGVSVITSTIIGNQKDWFRRPCWEKATARVTFYFSTNRRRDKDNLLAWLKSTFDGIADGGLIADDSGLTHLPVEIVIDRTLRKDQQYIKLEITRIK